MAGGCHLGDIGRYLAPTPVNEKGLPCREGLSIMDVRAIAL